MAMLAMQDVAGSQSPTSPAACERRRNNPAQTALGGRSSACGVDARWLWTREQTSPPSALCKACAWMLTRKWPPVRRCGCDRGMVFFNAANFACCQQAKEIAGFGYSDSAAAYDLEIFAAERAGDAKLVAELKGKRETAIKAYMASMLARSEITPRPAGSTV